MRSVAAFVMLALLASCSGTPEQADAKTMQAIADETTQAYEVPAPGGELVPGKNRLVFAVLDAEGGFLRDLDLEMLYARSLTAPPRGPVPVEYEHEGLGDRAFYKAMVDLPDPGTWFLLVRDTSPGKKKGAGTQAVVKASTKVPRVGDRAISMATPTDTDHMGLHDICSREPEDDLHSLSLDAALATDKPLVVTFSTPAFCASRVCGPVVDQVLKVRDAFRDRSNFIHLEVYTDLSQSEVSSKEFTEPMKKWNLPSEPWTFIIDSEDVIRAEFEGPVTAREITEALEGVL